MKHKQTQKLLEFFFGGGYAIASRRDVEGGMRRYFCILLCFLSGHAIAQDFSETDARFCNDFEIEKIYSNVDFFMARNDRNYGLELSWAENLTPFTDDYVSSRPYFIECQPTTKEDGMTLVVEAFQTYKELMGFAGQRNPLPKCIIERIEVNLDGRPSVIAAETLRRYTGLECGKDYAVYCARLAVETFTACEG